MEYKVIGGIEVTIEADSAEEAKSTAEVELTLALAMQQMKYVKFQFDSVYSEEELRQN